ncbi:hypothetical protein DFQ12_4816 [Sphingobacterium detergens]|uniref:Uncharacterized protein n=1 Tax=Sphingobacterium detergens TaxID=1145106 RepID=A0A420AIK8_SPHD1|nr:hypothetical protein DFQ12_4816 [Sphingobacterium detergens]
MTANFHFTLSDQYNFFKLVSFPRQKLQIAGMLLTKMILISS